MGGVELGKIWLGRKEEWTTVLVACGVWVNVKEKLIPCLMMSDSAVKGLDKALRSNSAFRADLANASMKDPPSNLLAYSDLASWLVTHVSYLCCSKQEDDAATRSAGDC